MQLAGHSPACFVRWGKELLALRWLITSFTPPSPQNTDYLMKNNKPGLSFQKFEFFPISPIKEAAWWNKANEGLAGLAQGKWIKCGKCVENSLLLGNS